jgi:uncharacterized protein involved in cysteine biosynthesis
MEILATITLVIAVINVFIAVFIASGDFPGGGIHSFCGWFNTMIWIMIYMVK